VRRRAAAIVAAATLLAAAEPRAHVVYGTTTLRGLVRESDVVARVRILDPGALLPLEEPVVVAEVVERIKGNPGEGPLRFVQHGHGVPLYVRGQDVALFAQRIERSRELASLAGPVAWVSIQEGVALASDAELLEALRAYAAIERLPASAQPQALGRLTVELLGSADPSLASSAVRDLALAPEGGIVGAADLPALERVLASEATAIGVRVALLSELERRSLVEGPPRWSKLLRETSGADRIDVVRAVAAHPSPAVTRELSSLLRDDDARTVAAAAISLGVPGNDAAVEPLTALLSSPHAGIRMAALRGLERIGTPGASASLRRAAATHPDAATRRRASAAVRQAP
jgi:hypothetical protein